MANETYKDEALSGEMPESNAVNNIKTYYNVENTQIIQNEDSIHNIESADENIAVENNSVSDANNNTNSDANSNASDEMNNNEMNSNENNDAKSYTKIAMQFISQYPELPTGLECPVIIWNTMYMNEAYDTDSWETDKGIVTWRAPEHCVVLAGYNMDEDIVYVYDPMEGLVERDKDTFFERYEEMFQQAVVIY